MLTLLALGVPIAFALGGVGFIFAMAFWGFDHLYIRIQNPFQHVKIGIKKKGTMAEHPDHVCMLGIAGYLLTVDENGIILCQLRRNPQMLQRIQNWLNQRFKIAQSFCRK